MSRVSAVLLRTVAAAVMALPLLGAMATPAAATHPTRSSQFFADHTRDCAYSYTEGVIAWDPAHPGEPQRVDVAGVLADRPASICNVRPGGQAFATFTAYVRRQQVDTERVFLEIPTANSTAAKREFRFSLSNTTGLPTLPIDQVEVQVCRTFGPMLPAFSCGEVRTYRPPQIGPAA